MKILFLGDTSGNLDEGMKNTTHCLYNELSKKHDIFVVCPRKILFPLIILQIIRFNPDIIHYLHGPSIRSLLITKLLCCGLKAKMVISATQPNLGEIGFYFFRKFCPDFVIVQSVETENKFRELGCNTIFIPSGVDLQRFRPISLKEKRVLRRKYKIKPDEFVVLHVGPIKENRNLDPLAKLKSQINGKIIIAGSTSVKYNPDVVSMLNSAGCKVFLDYFPKIEELYQLADCYVFPVKDSNGVIQFPLSVLEAMACGVPVISTPFGALRQFFQNDNGIYFLDDFNNLPAMIEKVKSCEVQRSNQINSFAWSSIADQISEIYMKIKMN